MRRIVPLSLLSLVCAALPAGAQTRPKVLILSIGDSSASGEGNPDEPMPLVRWLGTDANIPKKDWLKDQDAACHRSKKAGPRLAADQFRGQHPELDVEFTSFACSGAKAGDLVDIPGAPRAHDGSVPFTPNLPLQINQVATMYPGERIDALIVNIGINDASFTEQIIRCIATWDCSDWSTNPPDADAVERDVKSRYDALRDAIRMRLPNVANIYVNEYPDGLKNDNNNWCNNEPIFIPCTSIFGSYCDPYTSSPEPLSGISGNESRWASEQIRRLNSGIHAKTDEFAGLGWHFVGNVANRFEFHGFCGRNRWINQMRDSQSIQGNLNGAVHPNGSGHAIYRDAIAASLESIIPPARPTWIDPPNYGQHSSTHAREGEFWLAWEPVSRAATYQVAYRVTGTGPYSVPIIPPSAPFDRIGNPPRFHDAVAGYQYKDLPGGQPWWVAPMVGTFDFAVRSCTPAMCSAWSAFRRLTNVEPQTPTGLRPGAVSASSIELFWTAGSGATVPTMYHDVAMRRRGDTWWDCRLASSGTTTTQPASSGTWDIFVRACSAPDVCGNFSNGVTVTTVAPTAPVAVSYSAWEGDLAWKDSSSVETGFEVAYVDGSGKFAITRRVPVPWNVNEVHIGQVTAPWVRSCNDAGCSAWIGTVAGTPPAALPLPPRPSNAPTPPSAPANVVVFW